MNCAPSRSKISDYLLIIRDFFWYNNELMNKQFCFWRCFIIFTLLISTNSCSASSAQRYLIAPTVLPHTTQEMKTAGFWISRHPFADRLILSQEEIRSFNAYVQNDLQLTKDLTQSALQYSGGELKKTLEETWENFLKKGFYSGNGTKDTRKFFDLMRHQMDWENLPEQTDVQFGFVVCYADQRLLPAYEGLYEKKGDIDFDELQNSALDVGTPVVILHESLDKNWFYVEGELSSGWIEKAKISLCSFKQFKNYLQSREANFMVVLKPKVDIYLDRALTEHYEFARLGVRLPINRIDERAIEISFPAKNENGQIIFKRGFVERENIQVGYLSFTPRNILKQAFELLDKPYGWGDIHGEQDCSRFLQEVFATVGIYLPRNSSAQAKAGQLLAEFSKDTLLEEKIKVLKEKAIGGVTILPMKGHIMLYLGMVEDRPYAIHAVWGYREKSLGKDRIRVINRVAVSDLSLGEGSKKGSLLKRLSRAINISK